jgi:hypothetical protein
MERTTLAGVPPHTHCARGHPLDSAAVRNGHREDGVPIRTCGICRAAWARRRRAERAAAGLCTECGGERDDPAYRYCARCRALGAASKARQDRAERQAA